MNVGPILQIFIQAIGFLILAILLVGFLWAIDAGRSDDREQIQILRAAHRRNEMERLRRLREVDSDQIPLLQPRALHFSDRFLGRPVVPMASKIKFNSRSRADPPRSFQIRKATHRPAGVRHIRWIGGVVTLLAAVVLLSACNFPGLESTRTSRSDPSSTPLNSASIQGIVYHDVCENADLDTPTPSGCVQNTNAGFHIANGELDPGEPGLPDVSVSLGLGACPAKVIREVKTDSEGRFVFSDLPPYEYCVSAVIGENPISAALESGIWTSPPRGMLQVLLQRGEQRSDLKFGWDLFNNPSPATPEPTKTEEPTASCLDSAEFIKDVTVPDGAFFEPGKSFSKTWRLRNNGSCTWTGGYDLVFLSGFLLNGERVVPLAGKVEPGQTVDLTIKLRSPEESGQFWGYWMLRNADGGTFGIGGSGRSPFWVKINVASKITDWRGAYFDNRTLDRDPVLIRNDEEIDFDWDRKSPATGLPSDQFSVRWTRSQDFNAGIYRFSVLVDDGALLWVDDRLVIDEWEDGSARTVSVDLLMNAGEHDLKLEYFEREGDARIRLEINKISPQAENQWIGRIWTNRGMDSPWALVQTTPNIDFNWGVKSPGQGLPTDDFSALWSKVHEFEPGSYRFQARADDGVRIKIDDKLVIDRWHPSSGSETYQVDVELSGIHQVDVSYFEQGGDARIHVWWEQISSPNDPPVATMDDYETVRGVTLVVPAPGVMTNDDDPEDAPLQASIVSAPSNGQVDLQADGSFEYIPDEGFIGEDSFTYHVSDGELLSSVVPVTITVIPENSSPLAMADRVAVVTGGLLEVAAPGVLANDHDPDGDAISAELISPPEKGFLELREDGSFQYQAPADFEGVVQFTYQATDGDQSSEPVEVHITVEPSLVDLEAIDDRYEVLANEIFIMESPGLLENDQYPPSSLPEIRIQDHPEHGDLKLTGAGGFEFTPLPGSTGEDSFTYVLTSGLNSSAPASVTISIVVVDDLLSVGDQFGEP